MTYPYHIHAMLSLVGSERQKDTNATGERLKEAGKHSTHDPINRFIVNREKRKPQ